MAGEHGGLQVAADLAKDEPLEEDAQYAQSKGRQQQGPEEVDMGGDTCVVDDVGAEHVYLAVGEVQDAHDAEEKGQPQGDENVYQA